MLRNKYADNKLKKLIRTSSKRAKVARKDTNFNSRDIIISIFSQETEADKLQYTKSKWRTNQKDKQSMLEDKSSKNIYQPLKYLFPFLKYIAKGVDIDISGFIFVDEPNIHVLYNDKHISIATNRFSAAKIKFWLSHIYFARLRYKLGEHLLEDGKSTARETVHFFEEKEYMPSVIRGASKNSCPLVRKIKVSPDNRYRRQGQQQKQPFCIFYTKSGTDQELSFSESLSFVDYTFNLNDIIYIKILGNGQKGSHPISTSYSKFGQMAADNEILKKYRGVYYRNCGWQVVMNQMEERKIELLRNNCYQDYCRFVMLQIISYIEVRHFLVVKSLELQWAVDSQRGVVLSNVKQFDTLQAKVSNNFEGLATLYQKIADEKTPRVPSRNFKIQNSARYKRVKSQEKERSSITNFQLLPLQSKQKDRSMVQSRLDCPSHQLFQNKGKSCVLRGPTVLT